MTTSAPRSMTRRNQPAERTPRLSHTGGTTSSDRWRVTRDASDTGDAAARCVVAFRRRGGCLRGRGGFNLIEVMVSMGIFVIAFVAVASIFPTAITLQREATRKVDDLAAIASAESVATAMRFTHGELVGSVAIPDTYRLQPLLDDIDGLDFDLPFPARTLGASPTDAQAPDQRRYVWVPMIQPIADPPTNKDEWRLFIAVLRRDLASSDADYNDAAKSIPAWASAGNWSGTSNPDGDSTDQMPGLLRIVLSSVNANSGRFNFDNTDGGGDFLLNANDRFLDENGTIYVVDQADASGVDVLGTIIENVYDPSGGLPGVIWYAPRPLRDGTTDERPADAPSPLIDIIDISSSITD